MSARSWILPCAIAIACCTAPIDLHGQAVITGTLRQLTTNPGSQTDPTISGDIAVYTDGRNRNDDVYFMNVVTGVETQVTTSTTPQRLHDVNNGRIVYTDLTPPAARIRLYDIATGTDTVITSGPDQNARIDGQIVVFERGSSSATDVVAVDLTTNTETIVAATAALEVNASVSGSKIVYERRAVAGAPGDIVLFDLATHTETVLATGTNNRHPDIDGNIVVWDTDTADGSLDVVIYDISTGQTRTLALSGNQRLPHVSGRFMSFDDDALGNPDVAVYDTFTGAMKRIGGATADFLNDISGNRMVFTSNASGNLDIWMFEFQVTADSLYSLNLYGNSEPLTVIAPETGQVRAIGVLDPDPNVFPGATAMASRASDQKLFAWNNGRYDPTTGNFIETGELLTVNSCTGLATPVSPTTAPQGVLHDLAFGPDGSLFGVYFDLYRVDPGTGVRTLVGPFGNGFKIKATSFADDGTLYGVELTCGIASFGCPIPRLFTIDTQTGAATPVAPLSVDVGRVDVIVFNPATGKLLGSGDKSTLDGVAIFDLDPTNGVVSNVRRLVAFPDARQYVSSSYGMGFAPSCSIGVAPTVVQFGAVLMGTSKTQIVTISNAGATPLTVQTISLDANGSAPFTAEPVALPAQLIAGGSMDITTAFAPTAAGAASSVLHIATSGGLADVALRGTGAVPPSPSEQIAEILQAFDDAVVVGRLAGSGQGNSATGRLNALRNMLQAASDLIQQGAFAQACQQLLDVLNRTDGNPQPPDFVTGPAAADLAAKVRALRSRLGCP